ncbi:MAG: NAD(P)-dependent oxidoreductase [Candidatus Solibacter usitatus]|nr:NAD(P)-dependent oxidoreductase [Candidatus Solibacter usitatus]
MSNTIGIVGIGLVGTALSELLIKAGYTVGGYDIRAEQNLVLANLGGRAHHSAADVFKQYPQVILSLPTSDDVRKVLGDAVPGSLIIDTSTGDPADSREFGDRLSARGVAYVDATLGGSSKQIRNREAICICGGSEEAFTRAESVLAIIAARVFHVGPCGAGASMKLVLNLALGLHRAVLAEALTYADACGIDPAQALEILKAGPAYSKAMDVKGAKMLSANYEPEARLTQHLKDVRLILETGARHEAWLPLSDQHRVLLELAEAAGFGASDNSAVIEAYRKENRR